MIRCVRLAEPQALVDSGQRWTDAYLQRAKVSAKPFRWPVYKGQTLNKILLIDLHLMTAGHCSYCDGFPLDAWARDTIDHFRPKSLFPDQSFVWANLFLCCDLCQMAKAQEFDALWLKPDDAEHAFERYFVVNFRTGEIEVNPRANTEDQARAEATIFGFGLNNQQRPAARLRELRSGSVLQAHERPFRYLYA